MYLDEENYATFIAAYKQFMVDIATVFVSTISILFDTVLPSTICSSTTSF